ncbi:MAG: hypothetical protein IKY41_07895 [Clostridia bacterium]|nr:hypothetical protein [Clostridia bacterium]
MNNKNKKIFINDAEAENLVLEEKVLSTSNVLYEDTSKREKNSKHFRLKNGNFMAVMYDHPVHRLDPDTGKYVDIFSELKENDNNFEAVMERFKVRLPKTEGKGNYVTVEKDGREVSWKYVSQKPSRPKKFMATISRRSKRNVWEIEEHPSIKYEKIDSNIDLQYDVLEDGVKESIVLYKNPEQKTFSFQMKLNGLVPILSEDKKTVFFVRDVDDMGSELPEMEIPPAFMEDANETFCDDMHYEIRKTNDDIFLDLVMDSEWLSEPERAYPVVIDPRVEISGNSKNHLKMVEICSNGNRVLSGNTSASRRVGMDDYGNAHRLYIGFELPTLAEGFKITKAGFILYQKSYLSYIDNIDYSVASVTDKNNKELDVDSFTWSNVQGLSMDTIIDTLKNCYNSSAGIEVDMTETMNKWYASSQTFTPAKCIVIKKNDEEICCCNNDCCGIYTDFYSVYANYDYRPKMYIEYTSTDIYTDHQKYHTFENGRAGTGSINLFTGKMSFAHGDVTAEGVKLPLSVSHLYRQEYVKENANEVNKYGKGWKMSVEQTLDVVNKHGIVAVYTNAQGKRHYFMSDDNENGEIVDDAGLGLTYKEECNCVCGHRTTHVLTDEKGNRMTFNNSGKLVQLIDTNGNISCLNYTNGKLTSVVDGDKHSAQFCYDSQNKLVKIIDNNDEERAVIYDYDVSGDLISIRYPSAQSAYSNEGVLMTEFEYDANHRLCKVIDYTGLAYVINYDNQGRVSKLTFVGKKCVSDNSVTTSSEISDGSVSFEYRAKSTAVIDDRTKIKTVYRFDSNGRETSSYQDMTAVTDASKISESTLTELSGYESIVDKNNNSRVGKYRSLSVTLNKDGKEEINLLENGFFTEVSDSSQPASWAVMGTGVVSSQSYIEGKNSFKFTTGGNKKYLSQTANLCGCSIIGNVLVASAWAKASGNVKADSEKSTAKFRLCLKVDYEDGEVEEYFENYDTGYEGWQYVAIPFVLDKGDVPVNVTIKLDYTANTGTCYFTNARLVAAEGISTTNKYRTDDAAIDSIDVFGECTDIKMMTTKEDSVLTTIDYIDDNSDVVRTTAIDRSGHRFVTDYKYDSKHNLIKTQDYRGLVIEYTYNTYGKELTRTTYHKDNPSAYMFSEYTYQDGGFIKSESDPRYTLDGKKLKTTYQHDTSRNILLKQTAVNGQEYNYTYDDTTDDLISLSSTTDNKTNENQFFYTRGYLTRVAHNGFNFGFSFDELGRSKSVTVGDGTVSTTLTTMSYVKDGINDITETKYASGEKNTVVTDIFGNPIVSYYEDKNHVNRTISSATYDSVGKVTELVDNERGVCYKYTYDKKGNVTKIIEVDSNGTVLATNTFVFDANERLTANTFDAVGQTYHPIYEKNAGGHIFPDNEAIGIELDGKFTDKVTKDGLRRAQRRTFSIGSRTLFEDTYGYLSTMDNGKSIETEIVSNVSSHVYGINAASETLDYTYDKAGNLETIKCGNTLLRKYYYDGLNRLKREDNYTAGKTYVWDYDVGGNILFKKEYELCTDVNLGTCLDTKTYTYKSEGWRDRLDSFDGQSCTYDSMGNPINYLGHSLQWTKVRRLAQFDNNTFKYGANGIRYQKNSTVYTLDGNKILRESNGTKTITYYHGGSGAVGFEYNGIDYYFRKNLQGDVTDIYTSAGLKVASYAYDAWGKVISVNNYTDDNIGDLNPIRYRGYYYDVETGLYYLNSRYYDPETGRFINADTTDVLENAKYNINGLNLYAYCDNNPIAGRDDEGDMSFWKKLAIAAAAVVVIAVAAAAVAAATAATGGAAGAALCAVGSTFLGAAKGAAVGAVVGAVSGAATGAVQGAVEGYQETGTLDGTLRGMGKGALKGAVEGAKDGLISGMVSGAFAGAMNPSFCFVAGTTVLTTLGKKAIENIQVGDIIPCVDHITGELAEKKVVTTTVNKVSRITELDIDGEIIQCTETHPFQVKGKGWVDACNLNPGDVIYTKDWDTAVVKSVCLLEFDEPVEVFNFEVEDCHTYFVGEIGVLVHNANCHTQRGLDRQHAAKMNNTKPYKMNGNTRIPDYIHKNNDHIIDVIGEAKSVKYLSKSQQLVDMFTYGNQNGCKMFLKVEKWTKISEPLRTFLDTMGVAINVF